VDDKQLARDLQREGFAHTYVWQDGPNTAYPDHTHDTETAHIILSGEITLTTAGASRTYRAGERCDVPAGAVHSARMGPKGCRYLVGER
jgi:mannose-6-phosphate isomerase-like protein (cupin superfamily)